MNYDRELTQADLDLLDQARGIVARNRALELAAERRARRERILEGALVVFVLCFAFFCAALFAGA